MHEENMKPDKWLKEIAERITPSNKTIYDLEKYLITKYNAKPVKVNKERKNAIKYNVMNIYFQDIVENIKEKIPKKKKDNLDYIVKKVQSYPNRKLNLNMTCYYFKLRIDGKDIGEFFIDIERTKEYVTPNFYSFVKDDTQKQQLKIMRDILLYKGVTEQDIDTHSQKFLQYITTVQFFNERLNKKE